MAEYYGSTVLTADFVIQRGKVRGAPTRWCARRQFNGIHSSGTQWNSTGVLGTYTCE